MAKCQLKSIEYLMCIVTLDLATRSGFFALMQVMKRNETALINREANTFAGSLPPEE